MANEYHFAILKQGVAVWNQWRENNPNIQPDLSHANLYEADFRELVEHESYLIDQDPEIISLFDVDRYDPRWITIRSGIKINLRDVVLEQADLRRANLSGADLSDANLRHANLREATLTQAILNRADLTEANLWETNLHNAKLLDADVSLAWVQGTILTNVDLRTVRGLEAVYHFGPASIGIDTIYRSQGEISEVFLRGCGVPEDFITYSHYISGNRRGFYSCFISYSSRNQQFAEKLLTDLRSNGVRCWFAPHDMAIGAPIVRAIDESIRLHDKLLIILSKDSIESGWVEYEVNLALTREMQEKRSVLFPIRLDNTIMKLEGGWAASLRDTRHIGDFRQWKNSRQYQQSFDALLRDLAQSDEGQRQA